MSTIDFERLHSACPDPTVGAAHRLDPFYDGLFAVGGQAIWLESTQLAQLKRAGLVTDAFPRSLQVDPDEAIKAITTVDGHWTNRLKVLAALDSWHTLTGEQVAALTGVPAAAKLDGPLMAPLFAAGVLDVGQFGTGQTTRTWGRHNLIRPARTDVFATHIWPRLTWAERLATTGGGPWLYGQSHDRHNLLATELALRVAEFCSDQVAAVIGEKFSTHDHLFGTGLGRSRQDDAFKRADLTLVRADGLRIAVEIQASASTGLKPKIDAWARLLAEPGSEGVFVLFVTAEPQRSANHAQTMRANLRKAVARAARERPGPSWARTSSRIGVVSWIDWFGPERHTANEAFTHMLVERPTGDAGDPWRPVSLMDVDAVGTGPDSNRLTAVLDNCHLMLGVPSWQRETLLAPDLPALMVSRSNFDELPVPPPTDVLGFAGRPIGQTSGAMTGTAGALPRLRVIP